MNKRKIAGLVVAAAVVQNTTVTASALTNEDADDNSLQSLKGISKEAETYTCSSVINNIPVKKMLINRNYSKEVTINPKYIVIHDTDNRNIGAGAVANRNYFTNHPEADASAHYIVDDKNIVQALEDTWKGWHIGDRYAGVTRKVPQANNGNSIGIEITVNPDSDFNTAMKNAIELTKYLMNKYDIPAENVITHNDATGKMCPRMMLQTRPELWKNFKAAIGAASSESSVQSSGMLGAIKNVGASIGTSSKESVYRSMSVSSGSAGNVYPSENVTVNYFKDDWANITFKSSEGGTATGFINAGKLNISGLEYINKQGSIRNAESAVVYSDLGGTAAGTLYANSGVTVNYTFNSWANVTYSSSDGTMKQGFVNKDLVKMASDSSDRGQGAITAVNSSGKIINTNSTKLYASDSENSEGIGFLYKNDEMKVNFSKGSWNNVTYTSSDGTQKTGYVMSQYVLMDSLMLTSNTSNSTSLGRGRVSNVSTSLRIRSGAGTGYECIGWLYENDEVNILGKEGSWYKISTQGKTGYCHEDYITPVRQDDTEIVSSKSAASGKGTVVNVTSLLRIRQSASTSSSVAGYMYNGSVFDILARDGDWYKISYNGTEGYVYGDYVSENVQTASDTASDNSSSQRSSSTVSGKNGKVVNVSTGLRMRSGAGTSYSVIGWLYEGDTFNILSKEGNWYKINRDGIEAYVHEDYVEVTDGASSESGQGSSDNAGSSSSVSQKGVVKGAPSGLRMRKGAGTGYDVIGWLYDDDEVKIISKEGSWYKIEHNGITGYAHSDYISFVSQSGSESSQNSSGNSSSSSVSSSVSGKGTIVNVSTALRVRAENNTSSEVLGFLYSGSVVELKGRSGDWYKIDYNGRDAYVHSDYVKEGAASDSASSNVSIKKRGKVVNVESSLRIRENPSTDALVVGYLTPNETFDIVDKVGDWYKITFDTYSTKKQGYVYKDYVQEYDEVAGDNATGRQLAEYAEKFLGVQYVWGGTSPSGFDCSGFVQYVYKQFGISIGRTTWDQIKEGKRVAISALQPGDVVFFGNYSDPNNPVHEGMYIGDGKVIHASYGSQKIKITNLDSFGMNIIQANRFLK